MSRSRTLPQNDELVARWDRELRRRKSEVRDYTQAFHRRWARRGVTTIRGSGWAVRPFLLPAERLDFIGATFHAQLTELRNRMRLWLSTPGTLSKKLPFHSRFESSVDVLDGVWSPAFLSHARPDGFLFEDRFVLSELNYGNGLVVSCGYTEAVADYWRAHPVLKALGWDLERLHRRPLPYLVDVVRRFARKVKKPMVALVAHSAEWQTLKGYPKRVVQQVFFVRDELRRAGLGCRVVTEHDVVVDSKGRPHFAHDGQAIDLVKLITVGTSFFDAPELLEPGGPLHHFAGARMGDVWLLKPLAGLVVDKGALPHLGGPVKAHDGFRFEVAQTELANRGHYRPKSSWVIKRAFDGKDTHVGHARTAAEWRNVERGSRALKNEYVAQRYESLPKAKVPVFLDEQHLEWVDSRVELSSFLFDGLFGGAAGRHAPEAEGLVMSDAPPDYGFTTVFSV